MKDKNLAKKTVKQKKIYEDILFSYQNSSKEIKNLKELYKLASNENDEEIKDECNKKMRRSLI